MLARAQESAGLPVAVVLAVREFEAWFLAGLESLRGALGIPDRATYDGDPEEPRGAKGQFERVLGRPYLDVDDQVRFVSRIDPAMVRANSPSFDKLVRELERLVGS